MTLVVLWVETSVFYRKYFWELYRVYFNRKANIKVYSNNRSLFKKSKWVKPKVILLKKIMKNHGGKIVPDWKFKWWRNQGSTDGSKILTSSLVPRLIRSLQTTKIFQSISGSIGVFQNRLLFIKLSQFSGTFYMASLSPKNSISGPNQLLRYFKIWNSNTIRRVNRNKAPFNFWLQIKTNLSISITAIFRASGAC